MSSNGNSRNQSGSARKRSLKEDRGAAAGSSSSASASKAKEPKSSSFDIVALATGLLKLYFLAVFLKKAYTIRLHAIKEYGRVIHEFDPWFNFRATEYLYHNGAERFFKWFDYMAWYPLGRPVGTTIYPGLQFTSVFITRFLERFPSYTMSLNDVCVFVPAWFGSITSLLTGLLTYEVFGSLSSFMLATAAMSMVPAHLMRSVGGGYDNESIALSAMLLTFYMWVCSLRSDSRALPFGILSGVAYIYMVAAWGGYVFVLNMVGIHAAVIVLMGRFSRKLHVAYSAFYFVGTLGAIQIPVVGLTPLRVRKNLRETQMRMKMRLQPSLSS